MRYSSIYHSLHLLLESASLLSYKEREKESPKERGRKKGEQPRIALAFELTAERRQWAEDNTPEVAALVDLEISKMIDWCHRKNEKILAAERPKLRDLITTITDHRFHNWMRNAVRFKRENPTVALFPPQQSAAERNQSVLDQYKLKEGIS